MKIILIALLVSNSVFATPVPVEEKPASPQSESVEHFKAVLDAAIQQQRIGSTQSLVSIQKSNESYGLKLKKQDGSCVMIGATLSTNVPLSYPGKYRVVFSRYQPQPVPCE